MQIKEPENFPTKKLSKKQDIENNDINDQKIVKKENKSLLNKKKKREEKDKQSEKEEIKMEQNMISNSCICQTLYPSNSIKMEIQSDLYNIYQSQIEENTYTNNNEEEEDEKPYHIKRSIYKMFKRGVVNNIIGAFFIDDYSKKKNKKKKKEKEKEKINNNKEKIVNNNLSINIDKEKNKVHISNNDNKKEDIYKENKIDNINNEDNNLNNKSNENNINMIKISRYNNQLIKPVLVW